MFQLKLLLILLRPSWLSFSLTALTAACIVGVANWSYATANPWLYGNFYGEHGIVTTLEKSPDALAAFQAGAANSPWLYGLGVTAFALFAAVTAFVALRSLRHGVGAIRTIQSGTPIERHEQWQHLLLRTAVGVMWALYVLLTLNFIIPFSLLLNRIGIEDPDGIRGALLGAGAILFLWVALHVHIIMARLFCLRPRVFGNDALIDSILIESDHS